MVAVVLFGISTYGVTLLERKFDFKWFLPSGSYILDYFENEDMVMWIVWCSFKKIVIACAINVLVFSISLWLDQELQYILVRFVNYDI